MEPWIHQQSTDRILAAVVNIQPFSGRGSPRGLDGKESVGDLGLIPGLGRSPGERHGNPLQYSCLENPMDREAKRATIHGVAKSQTRLSD